MADNLSNRGPADAKRVNVNEEWELRYWTERFKVSEATLRRAVSAAGVMADDVAEWLAKHRTP